MKTINTKYDAIQVELLQLRETKASEPVVVVAAEPTTSSNPLPPPTPATRTLRSKRSAHEEVALLFFSFLFKCLNFYVGYTR